MPGPLSWPRTAYSGLQWRVLTLQDASELRAFLTSPAPPDPVRGLLAQRLYAGGRQGTSATAGARQALTLALGAAASAGVALLIPRAIVA